MMNVKCFEFNFLPVNTYVIWDETKEAAVIDPGCFYPGETEQLSTFIKENNLTVKLLLDTHLHFDHAVNVDMYPNATFVCSRAEWEYANNEILRDKFIELPALPVLENGRLVLVEDDDIIKDNVYRKHRGFFWIANQQRYVKADGSSYDYKNDYFGPMLAYIVTGSLVVEQIFAVPGIGRAFVSSITNRDYPMVMGTTIVLAVLIVVMNLVSDILYKVVDPRINLE